MGAVVWAVVAAVAVSAGIWTAYEKGVSAGEAKCEAGQAAARDAVVAARQAMIEEAAKAIAGIKIVHRTVRQEVEREIIEKPVFRECRSGPDLVRMYNDAIGAPARAGSGPDTSVVPGKVPAP